jgi:hypothetical protein
MMGRKLAGILLTVSGILLALSILAQIPGMVYYANPLHGPVQRFVGLIFFEIGIGIASFFLIRYGLRMMRAESANDQ